MTRVFVPRLLLLSPLVSQSPRPAIDRKRLTKCRVDCKRLAKYRIDRVRQNQIREAAQAAGVCDIEVVNNVS